MVKAVWDAKSELLERMIADLRTENIKEDHDAIIQRLSLIEVAIEEQNDNIKNRSEELEYFYEKRKSLTKETQLIRSRVAMINQLLTRFTLLHDHYYSDLERLEFVVSADYFLSQLGENHCPVCGSLVKDHTAEQISKDETISDNLQEASKKEVDKIKVQMNGLIETMDQLSEEHSEQETNLASLLLKIEELNFSIGANLEPKISETTGKIHELYEMRNQLDAARNKDLQIFELESELKSLGEKPVSKRVNILDGSETVTLY